MKLSQIIKEGRTDALTLTSLAKRHFGLNTTVETENGQTFISPAKIDMSSMSGFMAELKKLGLTGRWDPAKKAFAVS